MDAHPPGAPTVPTTGELLLRIARWIHGRSRGTFEPLGITPSAGRALVVLARADGPLRMRELADRLRVVPRSATSAVAALEAAGLVERRPDPDDGRSVRVHVLDAGRARLVAMRRARTAAADDLVGVLSDDDRAELDRLLRIVDGAAEAAWCHSRS
ncbi:MAG: MarR family transcriptional regulator [Solirubrobacteraceae bacterium]|nr:MarR family transcriptional regulator [Solirubrobacteraceae bacterium]